MTVLIICAILNRHLHPAFLERRMNLSKSEIKNIIGDAEKGIRGKLYNYGEDEIFDEIAKNIYATFKWVIERDASVDSDKNREIEDYIQSEKYFQTKYSGKEPIKEVLSDLTENQARILWFFKGCRPNQTSEEEKDDYYSAKRYIGFLLADRLLLECHEKKICPDESLKPEYVEYLQGVTIEEFTRFRAYLRWHDRNRNGSIKDTDKHLEDYLTAMDFLDKAMINCKNKECNDSLLFWKKIVENENYARRINQVSLIKQAKINTLKRLFRDYPKQVEYIEIFVAKFYDNILKLLCGIVIPKGVIEGILNSLYEKSDVVNMFEFILKCFLLSKVSPEEHNFIRTKHKKKSLDTIWGHS